MLRCQTNVHGATWRATFTLTLMASERATPNDESTSACGVRRLAAAFRHPNAGASSRTP